MKRNLLFVSAAIVAVLVVMLPAQGQVLGGGMHGAVSGMQTATFGGGFGALHSAPSSQTDLSASARGGARVDGLGRLDRTAKTGTQQSARDAERAKGDAVVTDRRAVNAGEFEATKASDAALRTTRATAGSTAAASVTATGQGETQVRNVDAPGAVAAGLSTTEASGTKTIAVNSKPSAAQPVKPDIAGSPHSSAAHDRGSPAPESKSEGESHSGETARSSGSGHGAIDANTSAAATAPAH